MGTKWEVDTDGNLKKMGLPPEENRLIVAKSGAAFDTINAAVAEVIARGDNAANKPYLIEVYPGVYNEIVTLENAALRNIIIVAPYKEVFVDGFQSTMNNANLLTLYVYGLFITGAPGTLDLIGDIAGTTFLQTDCEFVDCQLGGTVTLRNLVTASFLRCKLDSAVNVQNILIGIMFGEQGHSPGAALNITWDQDALKPAGTTDVFWIVSSGIAGTFALSRIGAAGGSATLQMRGAARLGTGASAHSVGAGCTLQAFSGTVRGSLTVAAGGTFDDRGVVFDSVGLTMNGAYTRTGQLIAQRIADAAARPATAPVGTILFQNDIISFIGWNGAAWVVL
jgi:hypothetical protein